MEYWNVYRTNFEKFLKDNVSFDSETDLFEPIRYMLQIGGKRIRPTVLILATDAFGADPKKAFWAALAIELFHNFSLMHDDIMDNSPLRRGQQTIHEKWDQNMAILSGDGCFALAYKALENYKPNLFKKLFKIFAQASLLVCEGQRMDILLEKSRHVTPNMYLRMIELKTAVLLAYSLKMATIIAKQDKKIQKLAYDFGNNLGLAFQIQDDYLDLFGNQNLVGKEKGNDIINGKRTYLYLKAIENASPENKRRLLKYFEESDSNTRKKELNNIKQIFEESNVASETKLAIENYTKKAIACIHQINIPEEKKEMLQDLSSQLMNRTY